tara:strand:+ start:8688 stop:10124 length:1437 start_codon:yes stop_codon:yes gene_type:complete
MAKGFGRLAMKVGKFAAILGGIALAAIIGLTVKGLKAVDTMAKLAQNIGTSVKSIQVLRHMATLGGVSIEKMDKAVSKMVKNIGETAMGIGTATDALKELGLDAKVLENQSPEKMFGIIADELNKIPTSARRASLASDIFGKVGQELIVTMKGGSASIGEMAEKLESLGVIIGDKQAQMVEKANDAWADIGLVWSGLANQLAVEFAPILTTIANKIIEFVKNAGGMGKIAEFIVKAFFYVGATVLDVIRVMQLGWLGLKTAVIQVAADITMAMSWATQKIAEGFAWLEGASIKSAGVIATAYGWAASKVADAAQAMGADTIAGFARSTSMIGTAMGRAADAATEGSWTDNIQSDMADFLKSMGTNLGGQAAESGQELQKLWAEGWNMGKVPDFFKELRESMMGEGFDLGEGGAMNIEMTSDQIKGAVDSLQTAMGGFKVEGDGQTRLLQSALNVEEKQLQTSKEILTAITQQGGGALQ